MNDELASTTVEPGNEEGVADELSAEVRDEGADHDEAEALLALNRDLIARYRTALLASDPAIEPELVGGETADEVEASFAAAQRLVAGIRDAVRREQAPAVPAGAPGRTTAGPHTAYDKIRSGLSRM